MCDQPAEVEQEVRRFRDASDGRGQITTLQEMFEQEHRDPAASIFDAQRCCWTTRRLMAGAEQAIRSRKSTPSGRCAWSCII